MADLFVEVFVLFLADVLLGAGPDGVGLVDGFPLAGLDHATGLAAAFFVVRVYQFAVFPFLFFHEDGQADVVGILADDALDLPGLGVVHGVVAQVQGDAGAARGAGDGLDFERAAAGSAIADPAHGFVGGQPGAARLHRDLVGHDEARIKAHAKLADQLRISFLVATEFADEIFGAAFSDGAQVVDGFLLRHANAVVGDGQGFGFFVQGDFELQLGIAVE